MSSFSSTVVPAVHLLHAICIYCNWFQKLQTTTILVPDRARTCGENLVAQNSTRKQPSRNERMSCFMLQRLVTTVPKCIWLLVDHEHVNCETARFLPPSHNISARIVRKKLVTLVDFLKRTASAVQTKVQLHTNSSVQILIGEFHQSSFTLANIARRFLMCNHIV